MIAFVFPGQAAQKVGMGTDLYESVPESRAVFDEANEALGFDVARLCFEGPQDELTLTQNAQPAILTCSIAALRALEAAGAPEPDVCAGHSLGEYSALVCAGALDFADAVRLVRRRGELMAEAREGTMAAILGLDGETLRAVCERASSAGVVVLANFNDPSQVVISGEKVAVKEACRLAKEAGAKRAVPLPVSGAFHSPLMREAADALAAALGDAPIKDARIPVIANVDAEPKHRPDDIRKALADQVTSGVLWHQSVQRISALGGEVFVEVGPGKILAGMIHRIIPGADVLNAHDVDSVAAAAAQLR